MEPPRNAEQYRDWLQLIRSENVGPATFFALLKRFGSAGAALEALPELARRGGRKRPIRVCPQSVAKEEFDALQELGGAFIAYGSTQYPPALAATENPPPLLSALGALHLLERPALAIVGARNASALGRRFAETLARDLSRRDILVVSGLARGIDTAAHDGALDGGTAAVLAGGLDIIYPQENATLHGAIGERGVLLSEMPLGMQPQARHFPRRNRIVSGLALATVVVEAAKNSGSLITARLAAEQGREVLAVPGSPLDPRAYGPNSLIREGATLVRSAEDVLEALTPLLERRRFEEPPMDEPAPPSAQPALEVVDAARAEIEALLSPAPIGIDELVRQSGYGPAVVQTVLLELELAGRLQRMPGQNVALIPGEN